MWTQFTLHIIEGPYYLVDQIDFDNGSLNSNSDLMVVKAG